MSEFFYLKIFRFLGVKFSLYLNRHVFIMSSLSEERATNFAFLLFIACALSVMICLLFLLVSLISCVSVTETLPRYLLYNFT